jgi:hypothetical protein
LVFRCFCSALLEDSRGTLFIDVFRSKQ